MTGTIRVAAAALTAFAAAGAFAAPAFAQSPLSVERLANGAPFSFADLIESVSPAVVSVNVTAKASDIVVLGPDSFNFEGLPPEFREFFDRFGDSLPDMQPQERSALGSGFIVSPEGHVVTNFHVIDDASEVTVTLANGDEFNAEILGSDESTDLAVLRIRGEADFPFVEFADEMGLRVGDWVVAVGNPFGLGGTATAGIVSATGREIGGQYNDFIQIDAPINRGNSGGPTFDLQGRVVGVNSQIFSPSGGNVGIGFAIPAPIAARVVDELIDNGRVVRGWLGVTIQTITDDIANSLGMEDANGAIVNAVVAGSPAADAGFRIGDVVLSLDGSEVEDAIDLTRQVGALSVGQRAAFRVLRDGSERTLDVLIGERPSDDALNAGTAGAGVIAPDTGAFFGLTVRPLNEDEREERGLDENEGGLFITSVERGGEADDKGLREGEVILQATGQSVSTVAEFEDAIRSVRDAGRDAVLVTVHDGRNRRFVALRFAEDDS